MDTGPIVELALPDGPLSRQEYTDPFCSKLGGDAVLLFEPAPLPAFLASLRCSVCSHPMPLLLQMDCPWPDADYDRVVYVFVCNRRLCTEHPDRSKPFWRAFIMARKAAVETTKVKKAALLWDSVEASWSGEAEVEEKLADLSITSSGLVLKGHPARPFPSERLHIEEEMIRSKPIKAKPQMVAGGGEEGEEEWSGEQYEQMQLADYSKTFKKFSQHISHYPSQCVRFSPTGKPLPFAQAPLPTPPACPQCVRERQFELQMMPAILSILPCHDERYAVGEPSGHPLFGDGMEWGSLYLYSCGVCTGKEQMLIDAYLSVHTEQDA